MIPNKLLLLGIAHALFIRRGVINNTNTSSTKIEARGIRTQILTIKSIKPPLLYSILTFQYLL